MVKENSDLLKENLIKEIILIKSESESKNIPLGSILKLIIFYNPSYKLTFINFKNKSIRIHKNKLSTYNYEHSRIGHINKIITEEAFQQILIKLSLLDIQFIKMFTKQ